MQSAKILDVTRSFIPINPNAYPENLHATDNEDSPETRVPVVPYMGYNFLPTSRGYKSFFGTNAALNIASLAPNKPDYVFIFQNLAYQNVLIALCDTGIWAKGADSTGAWTQLVVKVAPAEDVFYEWYYVTIKNKLYCFRANDTAFYKIDTDIGQPLGISCSPIVPTFITITAQLGMFKLGSRIGFWDGANAVAWGNPDDFSDFTPNVLTGANVTTFNSVVGKISNIRSHGANSVIYASKSIVGLIVQPSETFFVKAVPILQDCGVPYARQSIAAAPDTTHFAYTSNGIFKIENGNAEPIVPEIFDFYKEYTTAPIYLHLLQARYLCFEILDEDLINGKPLFSTEDIPAGSITFPGYTSLESSYNAGTVDVCEITSMVSAGTTDEQQAQANNDIPSGDKKDGTFATPLYTCYLSNNGVKNLDDLTWTSPCGGIGPNGTIFDMSPVAAGNKLGSLTGDSSSGKTESYGPDAYKDGHWTIQRFVQTQTAIWEAEEKVIDAFLTEVKERGFTETKVTNNTNACVIAADPPYAMCTIGEFVKKFSAPKFGYNGCSFWLTRYCLETEVIKTKQRTVVSCSDGNQIIPVSGYAVVSGLTIVSGIFSTPEAAAASLNTTGVTWTAEASLGVKTAFVGASRAICNAYYVKRIETGDTSGTLNIAAVWDAAAGKITGQAAVGDGAILPTIYEIYPSGQYDKTEDYAIFNVQDGGQVGVLGVDSPYCVLTHWKYTAKDGSTKIVAASACTVTDDKYPGTPSSGSRAVPSTDLRPSVTNAADGSFCGVPYSPPDLADLGVDWPAQDVTYPAASFLLQNGGIAPKYPTIYGFFCYDLHIKKWGKAKFNYKQLLDYSPINSESASPIDFANFGILAGAIKEDGFIYIFDDVPTDSQITWGKIGYYRQGMTDIQEVRFDFAKLCSGSLVIDMSLNGQEVINSLQTSTDFVNAKQVVAYPPYSGKWFNLTMTGQYDISFGEVKMLKKGRY